MTDSGLTWGLWVDDFDDDDPVLRHADGKSVDTWREDYPYDERLGRYEQAKRLLQVELLKLQYRCVGRRPPLDRGCDRHPV